MKKKTKFEDIQEVDEYLFALNDAVENLTLTGSQASLMKWDALIAFGNIGCNWCDSCGLCVTHYSTDKDLNCDGCPLFIEGEQCESNEAWDTMFNTENSKTWLKAARKFRKFIKEAIKKHETLNDK